MNNPQQSLGLIGVGAFGAFIAPHLAPHFDVVLHDAVRDVSALGKTVTLAETAVCDVVLLAVPVQKMESVLPLIAPHMREGTLVVDVASVKLKPTQLMQEILPPHVDIVGTHPLFGPQSGKNGIAGLNIAVCPVRGERHVSVTAFLRDALKLNVVACSAEEHDKQMAYVQGLTHLLAKIVVSLDLPKFALTTKTYDLMDQMVEMIRYDSDELFKAIERENPFAAEAKRAFFTAAQKLSEKLGG